MLARPPRAAKRGFQPTSRRGTMPAMLERAIDRLPALLAFALLLLLVHVSVFDRREPARLLAGIPAALLLLFYLRAGKGGGQRRSRGKGDE